MALVRSQHRGDAHVIQSNAANTPFLLEYMREWCDEKLWTVATYGPVQWEAVRRRLAHTQSLREDAVKALLRRKQAGAHAANVSTFTFPMEIWGEIAKHSDLFSIASVAATCLRLHQVMNDDLERRMVKAFDMVGLDWMAVRFMLRGTRGLLTGSAALCMVTPGCGYWTFEALGTMEFFANRKHAALLLTFLTNGLGWDLCNVVRRNPIVPQIYLLRRRATVPGKHPLSILIRICDLDPPRIKVFRSPLTSDFAHFDGSRLVVPYAAYTRTGVAIPNLAFENLSLEIGPSLGLASEWRAIRHNIRVRELTREYEGSPWTFNMHSTQGPETFSFAYRTRITEAAGREHHTPIWTRIHLPRSVLPDDDKDKAAPFLAVKEDDELDEHAGPHVDEYERRLYAPW
ncbi:hypothetical protein C8F01DRAFT_1093922 [Mycena amicta]|nr:hypothetical protein C8F01DRAFT_1093922 [Mycena amicta]